MVSPLEAPVFFYSENDFFNLVNANLKKKKIPKPSSIARPMGFSFD